MDLTAYLAVAKRWWWTLLVATWVAGLGGYLAASRITPTYEAQVRLLVGPVNTDANTLKAAGQLVQTYGELVASRPLLESTLAELGLDLPAGQLRAAVRTTANDVTRLLTIRVQDADPALAARLANTLADQLIGLTSRGTSRPEGEVQVVDFAQPPGSPVAPQVSLIALLAAAAGLIGALVLILLIEYFSDTVKGSAELAALGPAAVLGTVGRSPRSLRESTQPLVVEALPESRTATAYRLLSTKIEFADRERPLRSLLVVGAQGGEGAGEFAANLAAVVARTGRRVTLVDADPEEAEVTALLRLAGRSGVNELLEGTVADLEEIRVTRGPDIDVLPAGRGAGARLIDPERATALLTRILARSDLVIVAAAPVHRSANTLVWARAAEGTVVIVGKDQTKRQNLAYATESLLMLGARLLGAVLLEPRGGVVRGGLPARLARPFVPPAATTAALATAPVAPAVSEPAWAGHDLATGEGGPTGPSGPIAGQPDQGPPEGAAVRPRARRKPSRLGSDPLDAPRSEESARIAWESFIHDVVSGGAERDR